jgi:hypothetical protein
LDVCQSWMSLMGVAGLIVTAPADALRNSRDVDFVDALHTRVATVVNSLCKVHEIMAAAVETAQPLSTDNVIAALDAALAATRSSLTWAEEKGNRGS